MKSIQSSNEKYVHSQMPTETGEKSDRSLLLESSDDTKKSTTLPTTSWSFWAVFSSTFITIFLAEMGDKTQLVTLLMSAESQSPWIVFLGAALALITTSLLGVLIGYWLGKKLAPNILDLAVAILLLFITAWLINDILV